MGPLPDAPCLPCGNTQPNLMPPQWQGPPGEQGPPGINGTDGTNGSNAYTTTTASYVQPSVGTAVVVDMENATWLSQGQIVFVSTGGYYQVASANNITSASLTNLYSTNATPGTTIASAQNVSPGGLQGAPGDLSQVPAGGSLTGYYPDPTLLVQSGLATGTYTKLTVSTLGLVTSAGNLTAGDIPNLSASQITSGQLPITQGGTGQSTANAGFAALSPMTTNGDLIYRTGGVPARLPIGSQGLSLITDPISGAIEWSAVLQQTIGYAVLNCNTATPTPIPIFASKYRILGLIFYNASVSLTTVQAQVYVNPTDGGSALYSSAQTFTTLTSSNQFVVHDPSTGVPATTTVLTGSSLSFAPTVLQGAAATMSVSVVGHVLP